MTILSALKLIDPKKRGVGVGEGDSIHNANHTKQLPNAPLGETLGRAKILLTFHWDVIRLILQWFRVIRWNYTRTNSSSLPPNNWLHLWKTSYSLGTWAAWQIVRPLLFCLYLMMVELFSWAFKRVATIFPFKFRMSCIFCHLFSNGICV